MKPLTPFEYFGTTTFCDYKVSMTLVKRVFRKAYVKCQFYNLSSGYIIESDKKFKSFVDCKTWVEDVKQRIERGVL